MLWGIYACWTVRCAFQSITWCSMSCRFGFCPWEGLRRAWFISWPQWNQFNGCHGPSINLMARTGNIELKSRTMVQRDFTAGLLLTSSFLAVVIARSTYGHSIHRILRETSDISENQNTLAEFKTLWPQCTLGSFPWFLLWCKSNCWVTDKTKVHYKTDTPFYSQNNTFPHLFTAWISAHTRSKNCPNVRSVSCGTFRHSASFWSGFFAREFWGLLSDHLLDYLIFTPSYLIVLRCLLAGTMRTLTDSFIRVKCNLNIIVWALKTTLAHPQSQMK